MQETLIPFSIFKETGNLVEVGDVKRGRECGCICPSCSQGMIARQGEVKVWHFAHDQAAQDKPIKECDISFDSCCRQYAIDLLLRGIINTLCTPSLTITESSEYSSTPIVLNAKVTQSRLLSNVSFNLHSRYDISINIKNFNLFLFLDYENRARPEMPVDRNTALLSIDIGAVKNKFHLQKNEPMLLKHMLAELFENDTINKRWLYHPREEKVRSQLKEQLRIQIANTESKKVNYKNIREVFIPRRINIVEPDLSSERSGQFYCLSCKNSWHGKEFYNAKCCNCNSHLMSRFTAD